MKKLSLLLVLFVLGCTSAAVRKQGELTCLEKNNKKISPHRLGYDCEEKANPEARIYDPEIGYDGD